MNKNKKKINNPNKGTLDKKHKEQMEKFTKMNKSIPEKKRKLIDMQKELSIIVNKKPTKCTTTDIRRKSLLIDSIELLKEEIESIEKCTDTLDYIVNATQLLVDYYNNDVEKPDQIEEEETTIEDTNKGDIMSYFSKEKKILKKEKNKKEIPKYSYGSKTSQSKKFTSKAKIYEKYLNIIDPNSNTNSYKINTQNNICKLNDCDGEKFVSQNESLVICKKCGNSEKILLSTDKPNYKEPTQDTGTYAYKRINHLTEILSQLQAKESTDVPPKVFESIYKELKKRKINKLSLDMFGLKRILKKLDLRKYYEHVPHILKIINGKEPPNFSRDEEMIIKKMFRDIQKPFSIHCPKGRKNFLNYSYVLHKFCEILNLHKYVSYFPLLKNNAKLLQHDKIWKKICDYMRWQFIKSF